MPIELSSLANYASINYAQQNRYSIMSVPFIHVCLIHKRWAEFHNFFLFCRRIFSFKLHTHSMVFETMTSPFIHYYFLISPSSIIMGEGSAIWARAYHSLLQRRLLIGILSSLLWVASKASSRNILGKRDTYPNSKNRLIHLVRKEKV